MLIKKAFSLIELLVVIAIVTLLAAMLMPALSNKRAIARQTLCQSNLRQWGIIFRSYTQENDGKFYTAWYSSQYDHRWISCLKPYYDNPKILFCPQAVIPVVADNQAAPGANIAVLGGIKSTDAWGRFAANDARPEYAGLAGSYGTNEWASDPYAIPSTPGVPMFGQGDSYWTQINTPNVNDVPLFLDARWLGGFPGQKTVGPSGPPDYVPATEETLIRDNTWGQMSRYTVNRHGGYNNGTFLDLSVRKIGLKELWNLKWHKQYNIANSQTKRTAVWPAWMKGFKSYCTD